MPKQLRWTIKRDCEQMCNNLEKVYLKLEKLRLLYYENNKKDESIFLHALQIILVRIYDAIKEFGDKI
jgi:hypothetical protein